MGNRKVTIAVHCRVVVRGIVMKNLAEVLTEIVPGLLTESRSDQKKTHKQTGG